MYGHSTEECATASPYAGAVSRVDSVPVLDGADDVMTKDGCDRG